MLLTNERVEALGRINRFAGWTWRQYSVLEHSVIGARVLADMGHSTLLQRAFLLHDMEETQFGDIITPVKSQYMPLSYYAAVQDFNALLCDETGLPFATLRHAAVRDMDEVMVGVESRTVYTGTWRAHVPECVCLEETYRYIEHGRFAEHRAVAEFWRLWGVL